MRCIARFADGQTITRNTKRVYTHAWRVTYDGSSGRCAWSGFSGSERGARSAASFYVKNTRNAVAEIVAAQ